MRELYLDFIDEPKNSVRRTQPGGIYTSYYLSDNRLKIILLDNRDERDPASVGKDDLGEAQWKWLENELATNKAELTFIMSGLQIMPDDRYFQDAFYMNTKMRLYKLIHKYKTRAIFFSGDIHSAEILTHPCSQQFVGYPIHELSVSGLTETFEPFQIFPAFLYKTIYNHFLYTDTYNTPKDRFVHNYQYGQVDILWDIDDIGQTGISMQVRTDTGNMDFLKVVFLKDLMPAEGAGGNFEAGECEVLSKSVNQRHREFLYKSLFQELNPWCWVAIIIFLCSFFLFVWLLRSLPAMFTEAKRLILPKTKRD